MSIVNRQKPDILLFTILLFKDEREAVKAIAGIRDTKVLTHYYCCVPRMLPLVAFSGLIRPYDLRSLRPRKSWPH